MLPLFENQAKITLLLGEYVNAQLDIKSKNKDQWNGTLAFQTSRAVLKDAHFSIDKTSPLHGSSIKGARIYGNKTITLLAPATIDWTLPSNGLSTLFNNEKFVLNKPCNLSFVLKKFQTLLLQPSLAKFQVESSIPRVEFSKIPKLGSIAINDLQMRLDSVNSNTFNADLTGRLLLENADGAPSTLLPEPLNFKQIAIVEVNKNGIDLSSIKLDINNALTDLQATAKLNHDAILEFTQLIEAQYTLSPPALDTIAKYFKKDWPKLQEPAEIKLKIDPIKIDLKTINLSNLYLQGLFQIKKVVLQDKTGEIPILDKIFMSWAFDAPHSNIYTNIRGFSHSQNDKKQSLLSTHLQFWLPFDTDDISHFKSDMRLQLTNFPTSIANMVLDIHHLSKIMGPIIDLNLITVFDPSTGKRGYFDIIADSVNFHMEGRLKLADNITLFDPNKPLQFQMAITPESYPYLKEMLNLGEGLKIASPFTIKGELVNFRIPMDSAFAHQGKFDLKLSTTPIQFQDQPTEPFQFEGSLSTQNLMKQVDFNARINADTPIIAKGSVFNLFDESSRLQKWADMGVDAKIEGQKLTPSLIQNMIPFGHDHQKKIQALFGETLDLSMNCQLNKLSGPIKASIKGTQGSIHLDGNIKQGSLQLNQPLEGSVKMTPLLAEAFFARNVPLLSTMEGGESPITFVVDPSQFSCPLFPFQLDKVSIGKAQLNLGKIIFRNEGELRSLLNMISPIKASHFIIWFTPIYADLHSGIIHLKRFDLLVANAYPLANLGTIDLMHHRVDFVLGLSASTLQKAFGIHGLNEQLILPIPLSIANGKMGFDSGKITAKITSFIAQQKIGKKSGFLGTVLDSVLSNNEDSYPPPTTQPLPWAKEINVQENQGQQRKESLPDVHGTESDLDGDKTGKRDSEKKHDKMQKKMKKNKKKSGINDVDEVKELKDDAMKLLEHWLNPQ